MLSCLTFSLLILAAVDGQQRDELVECHYIDFDPQQLDAMNMSEQEQLVSRRQML